jgi:AraC-like DNA-binding protein
VDLVKVRLPGASVLAGTFAGVRQVGDLGQRGAVGDLFFGVNRSGRSQAVCRGHEVSIGPGDAVAIAPDARAFSVERATPAQVIGIRIPHRSISVDPRLSAAGPLRLVPVGTPALRLLTAYVEAALAGPAVSSVPLADTVVAHVTDLIGLCLDPDHAAESPRAAQSVRLARLAALKTDIERRLTDPTLSATGLAARHGISTRYLHKLFEGESLTFSQFVLHQRLALADQRLRHGRFADRTVAAIAAQCGFGDLSYFNRTFRQRYGRTPSEARRDTN